VRVSSEAVCSASGERRPALDLWDQVRAALLNSIVARDALLAHVTNLTYERHVDPRTRQVTQQHVNLTQGTSRRPFVAAISAAELAASGYSAGGGARQIFYAPDADVLFDDAFTDAHCFGVRAGDGTHKGLVALTFEPRVQPRRGAPVNVRGELWIDPTIPALVQLEFTYTGTDRMALDAGMGGTIHFQSLRNGIVFVDEWALVLVSLQQAFNRSYQVARIGESGGLVVAARWPDSTTWTGRIGSIRGRVTEKGSTNPAPHVLVQIEGVDTTVTDGAGRYEFGLLPAGMYSVRLIDTTFEHFTRPRTATAETRVGRGDTVEVNFGAQSHASLIADLCKGEQSGPRTSTILGRISDGSGRWPRDLHIESEWLADGSGRLSDATIFTERKQDIDVDDGGRFHVCGVVRERPIRMKAMIGKLPIADTAVTVFDSATLAVEWKLPPGSFAKLEPAVVFVRSSSPAGSGSAGLGRRRLHVWP
jgi:hypothetical protein